MSGHRARMLEDKYLRDSARALVEADIAHLRGDLDRKGVALRAIDRVKEGAADVYEEAVDVASDHRGALAALLAAIALWFARHPILSLFAETGEEDAERDDYAPDPEQDRA